ncbi:MAG: glutamate mutase L [Clostridia bacterium]
MPSFLITDVGSTTTKAILIEEINGEYRLVDRAESPTTVEEPFEDVNIGVRNAIQSLEKILDRKLEGEKTLTVEGIDYYTSSSAGGGLQVLVIGLYSKITAASANRAALGAGAILLDTISTDDVRPIYEKIDALRQARPDMILLTGGIDGGSVDFTLEFADIINSSDPKPRFGDDMKLPVIYAGNKDAADLVKDTLSSNYDLHVVPNLRPTMNDENLSPARDQIHELFLSHVMQQAPGYKQLSDAAVADIVPTPKAVGNIMTILAKRENLNILGTDIGGATTDIFSVIDEKFNRTVSANMGMSYSIGNVLEQVGLENVKRWLPFEIDDTKLSDMIATKMLFPTTLPVSLKELLIEQAVAREALRISVNHHRDLITALPKKGSAKDFLKTEEQKVKEFTKTETLLEMSRIGLIIGSGGVLSHAPRREQAALMLLDSAEYIGKTELAVDSIFMMPHLGVLSQHYPDIALEVLLKDCFIPLGSAISGKGELKEKDWAVTIKGVIGTNDVNDKIKAGKLVFYDLEEDEKALITVVPSGKVDVGQGSGKEAKYEVTGGKSGLVIDMRNTLSNKEFTQEQLIDWLIESRSFTAEEIESVRREE